MKKHWKINSGFTLIELMIVILMIGILSVVATPRVRAWLPGYKLKSAASDLQSNMQKARMLAVKNNTPIQVRFDNTIPPGYYYFDSNGDATHDAGEFRVDLSRYGSGVKFGQGGAINNWVPAVILSATPGPITFTSSATSNAASVYIENENQVVCYAITTSIAGTAKARKFNGATWN